MKLIERYILAVVGYLPQKDRQEVSKELYSNLLDMLPENPDDHEIRQLLSELGDPREMAKQYQSGPQYLIGPAYYHEYLRSLKIVLALGAAVGAIIGLFRALTEIGIFTAQNDSWQYSWSASGNDIGFFISTMLSAIIGCLVIAAFWTTVGFVIAERFNGKQQNSKEWRPEDLPALTPKQQIPPSDTIVELVIQAALAVFLVWVWLTKRPLAWWDHEPVRIFTESFMQTAIPLLLLSCFIGIIASILKLIYRRWTPSVLLVEVLDTLVGFGVLWLILIQKNIFHAEFFSLLQAEQWGDHDLLRFLTELAPGAGLPEPFITGCLVLVGLISVITIAVKLFKYFRSGPSLEAS